MLNAFEGRINRRTFLVGNGLALGVLIALVAGIIIPVAILDIAFGDRPGGQIISLFYVLAAIPAIMYFFYFCVMMVRRLHDLGYPGLVPTTVFVLIFIVGRLLDFNILNFLLVIFFIFLCAKAGQPEKNQFGPKPRRKVSRNRLKLHLDGRV